VTGLLRDTITTAFCTRCEALQDRTFFDVDRRDFQFVDIRAVIMFGIGDGRFENALDNCSAFLRAERQDIECLIDFFCRGSDRRPDGPFEPRGARHGG